MPRPVAGVGPSGRPGRPAARVTSGCRCARDGEHWWTAEADAPDGTDYALLPRRRRPAARPARAAAARRPARPVARCRPGGLRLDRRRLDRPPARGRGALRAARRHLHARGHPRRGGGAAGPPGRARRHRRRADAGRAVPRRARLGLRRRRARTPCTSPTAGPRRCSGFVDAAHARGLAVLPRRRLQPPRSRRQLSRPRSGPYFTDRHHTPWGDAINLDGPGSDEVRRFVVDNALPVAARTSTSTGCASTPCTRCATAARRTCSRSCPREVDAVAARTGRPRWLDRRVRPQRPRHRHAARRGRAVGGLGLHAQWIDDVHHALHVALTGETQGYYADFADPAALGTVAAQPVLPRRHLVVVPRPQPRPAGRRRHRARLALRRLRCRPTTRSATGRRATGCRSWSAPTCSPAAPPCCSPRRSRRCCSWGRSGVRARPGSSSPTTPTPRSPRGTRRRPAGRVRRPRLGRGGRPGPAGPGDAGAVLSRLGRAGPRAARPAAALVPRPDRAAPLGAGAARRRPDPHRRHLGPRRRGSWSPGGATTGCW